jgi:transglutaminase-like putative cysteine protease
VQRFAIREGWSTVLLTALVVFISVWSIQRADWAEGLGILNRVALAGLIAGVIAAKWKRVPVLVAHLSALLLGVLVVLYQMTAYLDDRLGSRRQKLEWLWDRGQRWGELIWKGEQTDDLYLFVLFISVVTFLLAYSSMWFVLKARWIWAALIFPGLLLFINLGYSLRVPTSYVAMYLFVAIVLLVRFTVLERETLWRRLRIEYPGSLPWRGMWVATYIAVAVLAFGWAFPASARSDTAHDAWLSVDGPWRSVESQFNDWFGGLRGPGRRGVGGFASFDDSFDLGGPLRLSNSPVVLVDGEPEAPYLAAHRYSVYTGRGWESEFATDSDDEDDEDDEETQPVEVPPQVELQPSEEVEVDPASADTRATGEYTLQIQRPRGSLVFAPEVFSSADIGVNLVVPWRTVTDVSVDISGNGPVDAPDELQPLIEELREADFSPPEPEPTPTPEATATADTAPSPTPTASPTPLPPAPTPPAVSRETAALQERGIIADFEVNPETYEVETLTYSGEFPMFDDIEAIYAREGLSSGQIYAIEVLESNATSVDLRAAEGVYPQEITDRYLELPESVTQRTRDLAREITAQAQSPYDAAKLIEAWLRFNIVYAEDIKFPPKNRDVVDYVLFDSRQGYCEYYASAFVVMMRSLNIPTRMVTGFFPADRDEDAGGFLYREQNAHAWPEVYFPGYGWIQFEPTANRSEINRDPAQAGAPAPGPIGPESGVGGLLLPEDEFIGNERASDLADAGAAAATQADEPVSRVEWAIRIGVLALMLVTLVVAYLWLRGMRGLTPAAQLYAKTARGAGWGGIRQGPAMTPHEYAHSVARTVPGSRGPATYIADVYTREVYGNRPPAQSEMLRARQAWLRLRALLAKHFFLRLRPWRSASTTDEPDDDLW